MNDQEQFWAGDFGNGYNIRNTSEERLRSNTMLFAQILRYLPDISSVLELGCGTGQNLEAIHRLMDVNLYGVEINKEAATKCKVGEVTIGSIMEAAPLTERYGLVMTKGVLIHQAPEVLPVLYHRMATLASKAVLMVEYFSKDRIEVPYRGHQGKLWRADFGAEFMAQEEGWYVARTGFASRFGPWPQDDLTWVLLRRK